MTVNQIMYDLWTTDAEGEFFWVQSSGSLSELKGHMHREQEYLIFRRKPNEEERPASVKDYPRSSMVI